MNDFPRLNDKRVENPGCGMLAMQNTRIAFWQSRAGLFDAPQLTCLPTLAQAIRNAYQGEMK